jgi:hypothetical protein
MNQGAQSASDHAHAAPLGWVLRPVCGAGLFFAERDLFMALIIFLILVFQDWLPLNPQHFAGMEPVLAFNTAVSFITNTDWQQRVATASSCPPATHRQTSRDRSHA